MCTSHDLTGLPAPQGSQLLARVEDVAVDDEREPFGDANTLQAQVVRCFGTSEVMMALSASEARKRLFPLIEQVNDDQEPIEIVSKGGTAYLVSADQWRSLMETAYLLRSPANAERLLRSIAEAEAGHTETQELIDPQHDVA